MATMATRFPLLCLTFALIAAGCGAPPRAPDTGADNPGRREPSGHKKSLIIAYGRAIPHIGPLEGGVAEFREIANDEEQGRAADVVAQIKAHLKVLETRRKTANPRGRPTAGTSPLCLAALPTCSQLPALTST